MSIRRVSPQAARKSSRSGEAYLVCAYDNEAKCREMLVEGAVSWPRLSERLAQLQPSRAIILYCA